MPERAIGTKLVLTGEAEYKSAIKQISAEYKTLQSQMKLVDSQFKGQQNTMAALEAKNKALNDAIGKLTEKFKLENDALKKNQDYQKQAASQIEAAKGKIAEKAAALEKLKQSSDDTSEEEKQLTEEIVRLNAELNRSVAAEQQASAAVEKHQTAANKAQTELNNLNGELSKNEKYLDEAKSSADGCAKSIDEYGKEAKTAGDESEEFGDKSKEAIDGLSQALAAAGVVAALKEIADALNACVDASIEFESAFAGVKKTVDATPEQLAAISNGIKEMSTRIPAATAEIAGVAEAAGQLGIATNDVLPFSEVMINLGVATNLGAEEAASALAKFANIMQMSSADYGRLGSTVVALGNNFATTEADITSMAMRLASTGAVVGLTESQAFAVATALSSVGIEAEAGGSAISKLLKKMETSVQTYDQASAVIKQTGMSLRDLELLADADSKAFKGLAQGMGYTSTELKGFMSSAKGMEQFSEVSGMTAREFQKAWGDDAVLTLDKFITGLGDLDESGTSAVTVLNDMGLTEVRLSNSILSLAKSDGILSKTLDVSNRAWDENNALTKEAEQRYGTTESKIQLYKNSVENLKVAVGDSLTPALANLANTGLGINEWATKFIEANKDIVPVITAVIAALGVVGIALAGLAVSTIPKVTAALVAFKAALLADPVFLFATALTAVTTAIVVLAATTGDADNKVSNYTASLEESKKAHKEAAAATDKEAAATMASVDALIKLADKENKSSGEKLILLSMVEDLNKAVPELNLAYDEQKDRLTLTAEAVHKLVEEQYEYAKQQKNIERYAELYGEFQDGAELLTEAHIKLGEAQEAYDAALKNTDPSLVGYNGDLEVLAANLQTAEQQYNTLWEAQNSSNSQMKELDATITSYAEATEEAATDTGDLALTVQDTVNSISTSMDDLRESYQDAYDEAYDSLSKQMGLLDEMDLTTKTKVGDVIKSLQSQIDFMDEYAENMNKAMEYGVDEGLVRQLADGSEASASILRGIVADGGKHVDELNEKLAKVEEGKKTFSSNIADMQTGFSDNIDLIQEDIDGLVKDMDQYDQAAENGRETMQGYIDGLNEKMSELNRIAARITIASSPKASTPTKKDGSHAGGLTSVPFDGYIAELHKGERILTAAEARAYSAMNRVNNYYPSTSISNDNGVTVRIDKFVNYDTAADTNKLAVIVGEKIAAQTGRKEAARGIQRLLP